MPAGRPTSMTDEVVSKLLDYLSTGTTIGQACHYAGISRETYYKHIKEDDELSDKMTGAQENVSMHARRTIAKHVIEGSINDAWKFVEKTDDSFNPSNKQELKGDFTVKWEAGGQSMTFNGTNTG